MKAPGLRLTLVLLLLGAGGCTNVPLEADAPAGFDLSGDWSLVTEEGSAPGGGGGRDSGFLAQDFPLLVAQQLRIEQDASSMGVEYGRGKYRDVTWGERRRGVWEVNAGWHEGNLHIFSEASDVSAREVYRLENDGRMLVIDIEVKMTGRTQNFSRVFQRQSGI